MLAHLRSAGETGIEAVCHTDFWWEESERSHPTCPEFVEFYEGYPAVLPNVRLAVINRIAPRRACGAEGVEARVVPNVFFHQPLMVGDDYMPTFARPSGSGQTTSCFSCKRRLRPRRRSIELAIDVIAPRAGKSPLTARP